MTWVEIFVGPLWTAALAAIGYILVRIMRAVERHGRSHELMWQGVEGLAVDLDDVKLRNHHIALAAGVVEPPPRPDSTLLIRDLRRQLEV